MTASLATGVACILLMSCGRREVPHEQAEESEDRHERESADRGDSVYMLTAREYLVIAFNSSLRYGIDFDDYRRVDYLAIQRRNLTE